MANKVLLTCINWNLVDGDDEAGCMGQYYSPRLQSDECPNCRRSAQRWSKKTPGAATKYFHKLTLRRARMENFVEVRKKSTKSNVHYLKPKRTTRVA